MALTTDFDILVSHKGKDEGRKEKRPLFFTVIHGTPKQVSDTAQSIGINERTRKNGLMSGVILPSQIAHDRWLSTYDAIFDALFIFLVFLVVSCFPIGIISLIAIISIATYMLFHIFWWENSMQWNFIETIIDYIKKTRRYYYGVFLAVYLGLSTVAYYYAYKYDFKGYLLKPVEYFDKSTSFVQKTSIFDKIQIKKESTNEDVEVAKRSRFSTEATLKKEENFNAKFNEKKEEKIITENSEEMLETNPKKMVFEDLTRFAILSLGFLLYFYFIYKYAYGHYEKKKAKNLEGVDVELKTDLELKMEEIKKLMWKKLLLS